MKIYEIMMYLLIFNMMLAVLVQIGVFDDSSLQPYGETLDYKEYASHVDFSGNAGIADTLYISVMGLLKAIPMLISAFLQATVLLPWFLSSALNLSMDNPIVIMFTGLTWLVYAVGILQLWMKQSVEGMA